MTNTHNRVIEHCSIVRRNGIAQTREKSTQMNCRISTCYAEDFLARLLALPDTEKDLEIPEEPYSLNLPDWLKPGSLAICCLKMFPACLTMTAAGRLRRSSIRWSDWGIMSNGKCLTARILAFPNPAAVCTLSDILMSDAEEKYFLSPEQMKRLLPVSMTDHREVGSTTQAE